jgi:hypothetical protein
VFGLPAAAAGGFAEEGGAAEGVGVEFAVGALLSGEGGGAEGARGGGARAGGGGARV